MDVIVKASARCAPTVGDIRMVLEEAGYYVESVIVIEREE